jgi:hypothetical protein
VNLFKILRLDGPKQQPFCMEYHINGEVG